MGDSTRRSSRYSRPPATTARSSSWRRNRPSARAGGAREQKSRSTQPPGELVSRLVPPSTSAASARGLLPRAPCGRCARRGSTSRVGWSTSAATSSSGARPPRAAPGASRSPTRAPRARRSGRSRSTTVQSPRRGATLAASGPDGRLHHLIDPATGAPAVEGPLAVTVVGPDAAEVEAYATALAVAPLGARVRPGVRRPPPRATPARCSSRPLRG